MHMYALYILDETMFLKLQKLLYEGFGLIECFDVIVNHW